jgi:myo-inositol-1(or 4)-monophosphatase
VSADLDLLREAAREAGDLALRYYRNSPQTWPKGKSVVSEADLALDRLLTERLRTARPDYGWLSEETADNPDRLNRHRIFVVDPIDGTRNFLEGGREWTISLAVVENGRPVSAVLFAPILDQMHEAAVGGGASRNGDVLHVSGLSDIAAARLAGPRRYARPAAEASGIPPETIRFVPSLAYRLALVAAAEIDFAIAGPGSHDWDLAAADLIVHEAGGSLTDLAGDPVRYNGAVIRHPPLVAVNAALRPRVTALVAAVDRQLK